MPRRHYKSTQERLALALVAVGLLSGAYWLRGWDPAALAVSTVSALAGSLWGSRSRRGVAWSLLALAVLLYVGVAWHTHVARAELVARTPERVRSDAIEASKHLVEEIDRSLNDLQRLAARAVVIDPGSKDRFELLARVLPGDSGGEWSAVLMSGGAPVAWAGQVRIPPDSLNSGRGLVRTEFYTAAYVKQTSGSTGVIVTRMVHASAPANRLASTVADAVARSEGVERFDVVNIRDDISSLVWSASTDSLFVRAVLPAAAAIQLRFDSSARLRNMAAIALACLLALSVAWRRPASGERRILTLMAAMAAVVIAPLNALSGLLPLFDPLFYYSAAAGPFGASIGALILTGSFSLMAALTLSRSWWRLRSVPIAVSVALLCVGLGPFVVRAATRGIVVPPRGASTMQWITWEVAIFLVAATVIVLGMWSTLALARSRWQPSGWWASALSLVTAALAPVVWQAPGRWPQWFVSLWILALAGAVFAKRSRTHFLHGMIVAACGATAVVWGAVSKGRVTLAEQDVASLTSGEGDTQLLLERLLVRAAAAPVPATRTDLLRLYVSSELAYSGNPVELAVWVRGAEAPASELVVADLERRESGEQALVREVETSGRPLLREFGSAQGAQLVVAYPLDSNHVFTAVAAPRTQLIPDDPFAALLGLDPPGITEPPYRLTVSPVSVPRFDSLRTRWDRQEDELHSDWRLQALFGMLHAHAEVDLRPPDVLIPRGGLLVLLDLGVCFLLWLPVAAADLALPRWLRSVVRRWAGSYRAQLTLAIFLAFAVPTVAFGFWTFGRMAANDLTLRSLLVEETLRSVRGSTDAPSLVRESQRLAAPLFEYEAGRLVRTSDPLYDALRPVGLFIDPAAVNDLVLGYEETFTHRLNIGTVPTVFGHRVMGPDLILGTAARRNQLTLERQERDLLALLTLAVALGALIALWLSGRAAQAFARPIGALRAAAEEIATGARLLPSLGGVPPREFRPVYHAFRHMTAELSASESKLDAARRRTEAVLRDVANGVIAVGAGGEVLLANPSSERMLGIPLTPGIVLPHASIGDFAAPLERFLQTEREEETFDFSHRGREYRARLTRLSRGDGGVVITLDDVTDLLRAQRLFAWGEMARQVAHEIKNPLTPIRLGVQHVRRAHADQHVDFADILERNVDRILQEIDRLDEIARSFAKFGTRPDDRIIGDPTNVGRVIRDVIELERLGAAAVEWIVDIPDGIWANAKDTELREVLLNLFENSRHAASGRVEVTARRADQQVIIVVSDDGTGVPAELLGRVFEPRFSTRSSGSGLGLAISKRMVESWGGAIHLRPGSEKGTVVELTLVAEPAP